MDGDLQNDPADIPAFVRKIDEGYDVVVGDRTLPESVSFTNSRVARKLNLDQSADGSDTGAVASQPRSWEAIR